MPNSIVSRALSLCKDITIDHVYIVNTFSNELEELAQKVVTDNEWGAKWDFEKKVLELVRNKKDNMESYAHAFFSSNYYKPVYKLVTKTHKKTIKSKHWRFCNSRAKYSRKTKHSKKRKHSNNNLGKVAYVVKKHENVVSNESVFSYYNSGLSSVYENMLHSQNWGFPKFANRLYNVWQIPRHQMIDKFAKKSLEIHHENNKRYYGYTFHSLDKREANIIIAELYEMYRMVQTYLENMTESQKNYIKCLDEMCDVASAEYSATQKYYSETDIVNIANEKYISMYSSNPPKISFDGLYLLTNNDRYHHMMEQLEYVLKSINTIRKKIPILSQKKQLFEWYFDNEVIRPSRCEILHLNKIHDECSDMKLDDWQKIKLEKTIGEYVATLENLIARCEHYPKIYPYIDSLKKELVIRNTPTIQIVTKEHILRYAIYCDLHEYTEQYENAKNRYYNHSNAHYYYNRYNRENNYSLIGFLREYGYTKCINPRVFLHSNNRDREYDNDSDSDDDGFLMTSDISNRKKIVDMILKTTHNDIIPHVVILETFQQMKRCPDRVLEYLKVKFSQDVKLESSLELKTTTEDIHVNFFDTFSKFTPLNIILHGIGKISRLFK